MQKKIAITLLLMVLMSFTLFTMNTVYCDQPTTSNSGGVSIDTSGILEAGDNIGEDIVKISKKFAWIVALVFMWLEHTFGATNDKLKGIYKAAWKGCLIIWCVSLLGYEKIEAILNWLLSYIPFGN